MSARVTVSGFLTGAPVSRIARTGGRYLIISITEDDSRREWSAFVFTERLVAEVERLGLVKGEEITVEGSFDVKVSYDGELTYRIKVTTIRRPQKRVAGEAIQPTLAFDAALETGFSKTRLADITRGFERFCAYMRSEASNANDN